MDQCISKRIKELSIEMLTDFDAFCKEHNLRYSLSFGTLLGSVRHKGFIPWDDDIDVDMPIEDYLRFAKLWLKYGDKEKYFFQSKITDPKIPSPFYRLRLNNTTCSEPGYETFPIHWGIPLDIFPIYHLPKSMLMRKVQRKLLGLAGHFCTYDWYHKNANSCISWLHLAATLVCLQSVYVISCLSKSSSLAYYAYGYSGRLERAETLWFPTKPGLFEGVELQIPADPHAYLAWQYGEDYMTPPPEDQRQGHDVGIIDFDNDGAFYTHALRRNK